MDDIFKWDGVADRSAVAEAVAGRSALLGLAETVEGRSALLDLADTVAGRSGLPELLEAAEDMKRFMAL